MAQYPIPQFIEEEGKIIYFLTFRQFFLLVAGGVICTLLFFVLSLWPFIIATLFVMSTVAAIAFIKIDRTPVTTAFFNYLGFMVKEKNYTWKKKHHPYPFKVKQRPKIEMVADPTTMATTIQTNKTNSSKLQDIKKMVETKK